MKIFNLQKLIKNRNKAAKGFKNFNFLKIELSQILLENLEYIKGNFPLCLDVGSHNGEIASLLKNHNKVGKFISLDFAKNMLLFDTISEIKVLASPNNLPFADNTFNLITSVFSLHSFNNIKEIFQEIYRVLQKDGVFLLSLPCFGNLSLLNKALLDTELSISNEFSNHIHPFLDIKTIGNLANSTGFTSIITNKENITIMYKSLKKILIDLRGMGENNILTNKSPKLLTFNFWNEFTKIMEKYKDPSTDHYPIKVEVCNLLAWKA